MSEQNLDELMRMRNEALRLGAGSKPWIDFATTMLDSLPGLYDTGKKANEKFAEQARQIAELRDASLVIEAGNYELSDDDGEVVWLCNDVGEGVGIPREDMADILHDMFQKQF